MGIAILQGKSGNNNTSSDIIINGSYDNDSIFIGNAEKGDLLSIINGINQDQITSIGSPLPNLTFQPKSLEFSTDGRFLAINSTTAGSTVVPLVVYINQGTSYSKLGNLSFGTSGNITVDSISLTSDGKLLAAAYSSNDRVAVFRINTNNTAYTRITTNNPSTTNNAVRSLSFSPDDKYLVSINANTPYLNIWENEDGSFTKLPNSEYSNIDVGLGAELKFSDDGKFLAIYAPSMNQDRLRVYRFENGILTKIPSPQIDAPQNDGSYTAKGGGITFSKGGDRIFVVTSTPETANLENLTIYDYNGITFEKNTVNQPIIINSPQCINISNENKYLAINGTLPANNFIRYEVSSNGELSPLQNSQPEFSNMTYSNNYEPLTGDLFVGTNVSNSYHTVFRGTSVDGERYVRKLLPTDNINNSEIALTLSDSRTGNKNTVKVIKLP